MTKNAKAHTVLQSRVSGWFIMLVLVSPKKMNMLLPCQKNDVNVT